MNPNVITLRIKDDSSRRRSACSSDHGLDLPIALALTLRLGRFPILLVQNHHAGTRPSLLRGPLRCRVPPFRHVHAKPHQETPKSADNEQDREGLPVISGLVDYRLDHVRPNDRRRAREQAQ